MTGGLRYWLQPKRALGVCCDGGGRGRCWEGREVIEGAAFQWGGIGGLAVPPTPEDQEGERVIFIPQQGNS